MKIEVRWVLKDNRIRREVCSRLGVPRYMTVSGWATYDVNEEQLKKIELINSNNPNSKKDWLIYKFIES